MNCNNEKRAFAPMSVETELSLYCALSDLIEKHSYCSPIVSPHLSERLRKYIKENPEKFEKEMSKYNSYSGDTSVEKQIKKTHSISIKLPTFQESMFEISKSLNNERISKTETNTEYAVIISVSALILSFLAFLFSLAKG